MLDGASALLAAGLKNWTEDTVHVTVPRNATIRSLPGVRHHVLRAVGPSIMTGLRRTRPATAAIRAAHWARTDRAAATILSMTLQQRLVAPAHLISAWEQVRASPRREFLDETILDVCSGSHSINELDVIRACRARGFPAPTRQRVSKGPDGRYYLDLWWDTETVHVEIQGAHHYSGTMVVEDAVRLNAVAIDDADVISLQIPSVGWRSKASVFLDQIGQALETGRRRRALAESKHRQASSGPVERVP